WQGEKRRGRVARPCDGIEPQAVQAALGNKAANKPMNGVKSPAVFHAQSGQCVDVEEPPVVDLAASKSPMREPIVLALEQVMQGKNGRGVASRAISPKPTLDHVIPVGDRGEFGLEGWRLVARGIVRAAIARREFEELAACRLLARSGFRYDFLQNLAVTAGSDGQPMLVIPGGEAAPRCIIPKRDVTAFQRLAVGGSKNRDQDAAPRVRGQGLPIDIERSSAGRLRSPFQDIEPPRVVGIVNAHVVGHEIENEPNVRGIERSRQAPKRILAAKLRVERIVVDHVISVRAARTRLEERGSIEMADAKGLEIRHQYGRLVEAEIRSELETVSRERD